MRARAGFKFTNLTCYRVARAISLRASTQLGNDHSICSYRRRQRGDERRDQGTFPRVHLFRARRVRNLDNGSSSFQLLRRFDPIDVTGAEQSNGPVKVTDDTVPGGEHCADRHLRRADWHRHWAARVKMTAGGWVD